MKTLKHILLLAALFIGYFASAQQTETRKLPDFNKLEISGSFNTVLRQGDETAVKITAENVDTKKILTRSVANTLKISLENGNYRNTRINVEVTYKSLEAIDKSGSGNLTCESDLSSGGDFYLSSGGSGNVVIKGNIKAAEQVSVSRAGSGNMKLGGIQARTIKMNFSGSGNFEVTDGSATTQSITLNGSGNVDAYGLKTETCNAAISGSGDIKVYASNSLNATISGSGNINYQGDAQVKQIQVNGSGRINKKG